ncbi:MAG: glycosyltransferase family 2 protein [Flavobacteriales bacterium]
MLVDVIIPAWNEEMSIPKVIQAIPKNVVREVIVVDNNSTDRTKDVAAAAGATVLLETFQGYGAACLKGIDYINHKDTKPDVVAFMDADFSDFPEQLVELLEPIEKRNMDMVIGSRALGKRQDGSMMPQQIFGNWLATSMMRILYKVNFTDLGPFRTIKLDVLNSIGMQDKTYGWTVEMQVKIAKANKTFEEVPVDYKRRIGTSKIAGTVKGTILAGYKIITTIIKYR